MPAVFRRSVLRLDRARVDEFLIALSEEAAHVEPVPLDPAGFRNASDAPFYAPALACLCPPVTGSLKHFPSDGPVAMLSLREVVEKLRLQP